MQTEVWELDNLGDAVSEESSIAGQRSSQLAGSRDASFNIGIHRRFTNWARDLLGEPDETSCAAVLARSPKFVAIGVAMTMLSCVAVAIETDLSTSEALRAAMGGEREQKPPWRMGLQIYQHAFHCWLAIEAGVAEDIPQPDGENRPRSQPTSLA